MIVCSRSNLLYKKVRHLLQSSQARKEKNLAVIEGIHLALAALQSLVKVEHWIISEDYLNSKEAKEMVEQFILEKNIPVSIFKTELFSQLSQLSTPNFILGLICISETNLPLGINGDVIILDAIQDAGNVGSILRSAAGVNIDTIITTLGTASIWSNKVLRAAMGAHFKLHIIENKLPVNILKILQTPILATAINNDECNKIALKQKTLYDIDLKPRLAWVFGNEGQGVSKAWLDAAHYHINIPITANIESLNVAAAAAVCLFEQRRQRI